MRSARTACRYVCSLRLLRAVVLGAALAHVLSPTPAAHDLQHTVAEGEAITVQLQFPDGTAFDFESYEIYRDGEEVPFQVGRTDAEGRIAFLPDGPGTWRVKTFADDGHGKEFTLTTDHASRLVSADLPLYQRYGKVFVGAGFILGLFGLLSLFYRRSAR